MARRCEFERFLARVHRRYVLVRAIESTGLGLFAGCAAGVPLTLVVLWRGLPAMPLAVTALVAGACAGLIRAMLHRPTKLASAMEADRQLASADLLGSALLVHHSADPWAREVVVQANQWCAVHSPSSVLLNRLGARAWGGIGLATMLVLVLALLPIVPVQGIASQSGVNLASDQPGPNGISRTPFSRRTTTQLEPEDLHPNRMTGAANDDRRNDQQTASGAVQRPGSNAAAGDGAGESHAQARDLKGPTAPRSVDGGSDSSGSGRVASGAGGSVTSAGASSNTVGGGTAAANNARGTPPWRSDHWAGDIDRANQALRSGQIPDQYRDIIRGYFDRANAR